jgi:hypothetical protein
MGSKRDNDRPLAINPRARLGDGVVVDVSGEREQQGEANQLVVRVHGVGLGGLTPHVRVGERLQV